MTEEIVQKPAGKSTGKVIAIGCGLVLIVAVFAVVVVVSSLKKAVVGYVDAFTSTEAVELAAPMGSEADAQTVIGRFDDFINALEIAADVDALSLDGNEINQLIFYHPEWEALSDKVRVALDGEGIGGEVSIPLDHFAKVLDALKGRYLNGSARFSIGLTGGRLVVFVDALEVNGKTVPQAVIDSMKAQNFFEEANNNPKLRKHLDGLQAISMENGRLTIVPKPVAER